MTRYIGQKYENSDDFVNDVVAAQRRKKESVACKNCAHWSTDGYCNHLKKSVRNTDWCSNFQKK